MNGNQKWPSYCETYEMNFHRCWKGDDGIYFGYRFWFHCLYEQNGLFFFKSFFHAHGVFWIYVFCPAGQNRWPARQTSIMTQIHIEGCRQTYTRKNFFRTNWKLESILWTQKSWDSSEYNASRKIKEKEPNPKNLSRPENVQRKYDGARILARRMTCTQACIRLWLDKHIKKSKCSKRSMFAILTRLLQSFFLQHQL